MWTVSGQDLVGNLTNGIQCCCETATTLSYYYNWILTNDTPIISTGKEGYFLPPVLGVEVTKTVPYVCLSACQRLSIWLSEEALVGCKLRCVYC